MMSGVAVAPGVNQVIVFPSDSFVVKGLLGRLAFVMLCGHINAYHMIQNFGRRRFRQSAVKQECLPEYYSPNSMSN